MNLLTAVGNDKAPFTDFPRMCLTPKVWSEFVPTIDSDYPSTTFEDFWGHSPLHSSDRNRGELGTFNLEVKNLLIWKKSNRLPLLYRVKRNDK